MGPRARSPTRGHFFYHMDALSCVPFFPNWFDPLWPLGCLRADTGWYINWGGLRNSREWARKSRKSERAKIESFILCPAFLMPNNAKQGRSNCHNPIFTPGIFSDVGMQNEAARVWLVWPERGSVTLKNSQNMAGSTFFEVWAGLTKVDQVWPKFDQGLTRPKARFD